MASNHKQAAGVYQLLSSFERATEMIGSERKFNFNPFMPTPSTRQVPKEYYNLIVSDHIPNLHQLILTLKDKLQPGVLFHLTLRENSVISLPIEISEAINQIQDCVESFHKPIDSRLIKSDDLLIVKSTLVWMTTQYIETLRKLCFELMGEFRPYLEKISNKTSEGPNCPSWRKVLLILNRICNAINVFRNELTSPDQQQYSVVVSQVMLDSVIRCLVSNFNQAAIAIRRGRALGYHVKYSQRNVNLVLELARGEYAKINSEYLPMLRGRIVALKNALDSQNLLPPSPDMLSWSSVFDLPVIISTLITKIITAFKPIDNTPNWVSNDESTSTESIFILFRNCYSTLDEIDSLARRWEDLTKTYANCLKTLKNIPVGGLPCRFWPKVLKESEKLLRSSDQIDQQITKYNNHDIQQTLRGSLKCIEFSISCWEETFIQLEDEDETEPNSAQTGVREICLQNWMGILFLFRILLRRLSFRDQNSTGIATRLSERQLFILNCEFEEWTEKYDKFFHDVWHGEEIDQALSGRVLESLERIRDVLLLGKSLRLRPVDVLSKQDFDPHKWDQINSKIGQLVDDIEVDKSDEERVWVKTWLNLTSLATQKSLARLKDLN